MEVEVKGRKEPALVAKLDTLTPLLGVYALETLGFKVEVTITLSTSGLGSSLAHNLTSIS